MENSITCNVFFLLKASLSKDLVHENKDQLYKQYVIQKTKQQTEEKVNHVGVV